MQQITQPTFVCKITKCNKFCKHIRNLIYPYILKLQTFLIVYWENYVRNIANRFLIFGISSSDVTRIHLSYIPKIIFWFSERLIQQIWKSYPNFWNFVFGAKQNAIFRNSDNGSLNFRMSHSKHLKIIFYTTKLWFMLSI